MAREIEIQRAIMDWLRASGICAWRCSLGGVRKASGIMARNPMRGFPDLAGIRPTSGGKFFVIEVKTTRGRLSADQLAWKERLERQGVLYILATSVECVRMHLDPLRSVATMATNCSASVVNNF